MMAQMRDRYLTLALGLCWHEPMLTQDQFGNPVYICRHCGLTSYLGIFSKPNFSDTEWSNVLIEWTFRDKAFRDMFLDPKYVNPFTVINGYTITTEEYANRVYFYLLQKDNEFIEMSKNKVDKKGFFKKLFGG